MADNHLPDVAGAVLTGGSSRRMGRDKALIEVDGHAMVDRVGAVLIASGCVSVVAVGPVTLAGGFDHIDDCYPGEGPLGAVLTTLRTLSSRVTRVCVVACDLPWLDTATIHRLMSFDPHDGAGVVDVVMARTDRLEPLCAIWNISAKAALQLAFDNGERAIHAAIRDLRVTLVDVPATALRNVNTPDDLPSR